MKLAAGDLRTCRDALTWSSPVHPDENRQLHWEYLTATSPNEAVGLQVRSAPLRQPLTVLTLPGVDKIGRLPQVVPLAGFRCAR